MEFSAQARTLAATVQGADRILLVTHTHPDADAVGSITAMAEHLAELGKSPVLYCPTPPPPHLTALPHVVRWVQGISDHGRLAGYSAQLIISLDASDFERSLPTEVRSRLAGNGIVANIDHHVTNPGFGAINLIVPQAASTTEILSQYFHELGHRISPATAASLLLGIVGDTSAFTNQNTTPATLATAARLVAAGAPPQLIAGGMSSRLPLPLLRLWGTALSRLRRHPTYGIAVTALRSQELAGFADPAAATDGLSNFLNRLGDVRAVLVLREQPDGTIRGSLRTNDDLIDVAKLAILLGGGGHRKAAGFTLTGRLVETPTGWKIE